MSVASVVGWIRSLELGNLGELYASRFEGAGVEWVDLLELDEPGLAELGVHQVHTAKILRCLAEATPPPADSCYPTSYNLAKLEATSRVLTAAALQKADAQIEQLRLDLAASEQRAASGESLSSARDAEAARLQRDLDQATAALESAQGRNAELERKAGELERRLAESEARVRTMQEKSAADLQESAEGDQVVRAELAEQRAACQKLQTELAAAQQATSSEKSERERLEVESKKWEERHSETEHKLQAISSSEDSLKKELARLSSAASVSSVVQPAPAPVLASAVPTAIDTKGGVAESPVEVQTPAAASPEPVQTSPATESAVTASAPPARPASAGGVDDIADKQKLIELYNEYDPSKVPKIDAILQKRPKQVDRDKMWSDLRIKYPNFFRSASGTEPAAAATPPAAAGTGLGFLQGNASSPAAVATTPAATPSASSPAVETPSEPVNEPKVLGMAPVSAGEVDDDSDRQRLTELYTAVDPSKLKNVEAILQKRKTRAERAKMWSDLEKKYPAHFSQSNQAGESSLGQPSISLSSGFGGSIFGGAGGMGLAQTEEPEPELGGFGLLGVEQGGQSADAGDQPWGGLASANEPGMLDDGISELDNAMTLGGEEPDSVDPSTSLFTGIMKSSDSAAPSLSFGGFSSGAPSWGKPAAGSGATGGGVFGQSSGLGINSSSSPSAAGSGATGGGVFGQSSGLGINSSSSPSAAGSGATGGGVFGQSSGLGINSSSSPSAAGSGATGGGVFGQSSGLGINSSSSPSAAGVFGQSSGLGSGGRSGWLCVRAEAVGCSGFGQTSGIGQSTGFGKPSALGSPGGI